MPEIRVQNLRKSFGASTVLDGIGFTVRDKEFVTLLGPSGCGKTTTLMSIAGFQTPDEGVIAVGGDVFVDRAAGVDLPAERRDLGIVFQSYAVWPHMTVAQNVAFPLSLRKVDKRTARGRVAEVLELVELGAHADRYPHQLSGGQQQRVALARAIAPSPRVLLLDEPFSNLDAKLRERARDRLKQLQLSLGLTTVFVTHDQDEALAMSDRILVMNGGRILRDGTPEEVYREPGARFVAEFLGQCNFVTGSIETGPGGGAVLRTRDFPDGIAIRADGVSASGAATVAVRPHDIELCGPDGNGAEGTVVESVFLGDHYRYTVAVGGARLEVHAARPVAPGPVRVRIPPHSAVLVD
ncbi:ABC transporter ATP-binding protein [Actinospica sp. MGRD01-02]|uniref:ABC-type quaternary amine transporter n=1 Tax=Actinospica acidithermotolerans TaxID=2828514 RepID=A0A941IIU2_9ACTN|nr:ABC transporter ATP-binding protein [Actinospica acidithermotolerans]MBR7825101.1 ABC transporter ATP-binding protein [Actinospica acidithermotolerans]